MAMGQVEEIARKPKSLNVRVKLTGANQAEWQ